MMTKHCTRCGYPLEPHTLMMLCRMCWDDDTHRIIDDIDQERQARKND